MKRFVVSVLAISILLWCVPAYSQAALVAHAISSSTDGDAFTSSAIDSTGANFCFVGLSSFPGAGGDVIAPTDSKGNTYTALTARLGPGGSLKVIGYYVVSPTVGSGHTVTVNTTGVKSYSAVNVRCYSGVTTVSTIDTEGAGGSATGGTSVAAGSITPSSSSNVIIGCASFTSVVSAITLSGYSNLDALGGGSSAYVGLACGDKIGSLGGSENPTFGWTTSSDAAAADVSIKAAGGGGGGGAISHGMLSGVN